MTRDGMYLLPDPKGYPHIGAGTGFARWPALVPLRVEGRVERLAPRDIGRPTLLPCGRWSHHPGKVRR